MLKKLKQKIKSGAVEKKSTVSFCTSVVFFALAMIQAVILLLRFPNHFADYILLIIVDVIAAVVFLFTALNGTKHNSSNKK